MPAWFVDISILLRIIIFRAQGQSLRASDGEFRMTIWPMVLGIVTGGATAISFINMLVEHIRGRRKTKESALTAYTPLAWYLRNAPYLACAALGFVMFMTGLLSTEALTAFVAIGYATLGLAAFVFGGVIPLLYAYPFKPLFDSERNPIS